MIKEYFANYFLHMSDVTFDMAQQPRWRCTSSNAEPWRVTLVDTGEETHDRRPPASASRDYVEDDEAFCFTYGDGVADVDIARADRLPPRARQAGDGHRRAAAGPLRRARASTATACAASTRSRAATAAGSTAASSCCRRSVLDCIDGDATIWEARAAGAPGRATAS